MRKDQSDILRNDEEHDLMPFIIEEMKSKIGREKMVTGKQIVSALAKQMTTSEPVVQKIINHIILNDIIPGLIVIPQGYYHTEPQSYYVTYSECEMSVYMDHLQDMEKEYRELRNAIKRQRASIKKHRVWASIEMVGTGRTDTIEEAVALQQVTMADYEKYKDTCSFQPG